MKNNGRFYPAIPTPTFILPSLQRPILQQYVRHGWISFGHGILYVRESYRTIASSITPGINKTIITGTPGIGKSLFLIYLLWKLFKEAKRVFVVYDEFKYYFDKQGGVFSLDDLPGKSNSSFWNDTLWCLYDSKGQSYCDLHSLPYQKCTFVLSASPRAAMLKDFIKPPEPQVFYMPTWTEAELEAIATLFPSEIKWRDRFCGIPLHVLEVTSRSTIEMLEEACLECTLDDCTQQIFMNSAITENVYPLVHLHQLPRTQIRPCATHLKRP
jgi:hypothetical protein